MQEVKKRLENFLFSHGVSLTEIIVQCDSDCTYFTKAGALQYTRKGVAYKLADYVAWSNNKNKNSESINEIDFTMNILTQMKKILKLT